VQERQSWLRVLAAMLALAGAAVAAATVLQPRADARLRQATFPTRLEALKRAALVVRVQQKRDEAWRWQRLMGKSPHPYGRSVQRSQSLGYNLWVLRLWSARAARAKRQALRPPHRDAWLCIHRYEATWADPNSPYYGGLQMDLEFQRTYGSDLVHRKGTADHWTPLEQMWVAERAFRSGRGFYPWPNTARSCGLI
jgi:hypothetical protein